MGDRRVRRIGWVVVVAMGCVLVGVGPTGAEPATAQQNPLDGVPLCGVEAPVGAAATAADDGVLRVGTLNVLHSETDDGDISLGDRLPLLADAVAASGIDIVGAQEVTRNVVFDPASEAPQRHGLVAQRLAAAIAARTGQPWAWCWSLSNPHVPLSPDLVPGGGNPLDSIAAANGNAPDPGDFSEGLAILTRFQIEASRFRRLTPRSFEAAACIDLDPFCPLAALFDSRQVLWARVASPAGEVDMFTTHLAHTLTPLSDTTRAIQVEQALAITSEWASPDDLPDLLVGDFNSTPDSPVIAAATDAGFIDTYRAADGPECAPAGTGACSGGPTDGTEVFSPAPQRTMSGRIDYVLARPSGTCALTVPASEVIADEPSPQADGRWLWPSDHLGFASTVSCGPAPSPADTVAVSPTAPADVENPTAGGRLPATGDTPQLALAMLLAALGITAAAATRRRRTRSCS
jgi:endonuclease/exonuclease/phosphatase family metal-dependent hydrolase